MTDRDTMRWVWRGTALAALLIGWLFIAWQNHYHITAPVVIVCLAYLAVVATVYNLWRTGAAAVNTAEDQDDSTWAKPAGRLGELEREKRTLLKAIKEAEFDLQMGKLSKHDADEMIRAYRARAIEVIKDIDHLGLGAAGTPREQIMREVRARLELDAKAHKKADAKGTGKAAETGAKGKATKGGKDKPASAGKKASAAGEARAEGPADKSDAAARTDAASDAAVGHGTAATADASGNAAAANGPAVSAGTADSAAADASARASAKEAAEEGSEAENEVAAPTGAASLDDEAMDADSTTAVDPARDRRAKEATP